MEEYLNRNQLKYLTGKLVDDDILTKSGSGNQTTYSLAKPYQSLRGDDLFKSVFDVLRSKNVEG